MTRTVFTGGEVFDGTGSAPERADVLVEDGRIIAVGSGLDGDSSVDCAGRTVLPGLFDAHVHVAMSTHISMSKKQTDPFSYHFFESAVNLRKTLALGITTVRDAGGADLGVKRAVEDGLIPGPRMRISIGALSQTGGHGDFGNFPYPGCPATVVDGPEEVRKAARELLKAGADQLQVCTTGGVLSPGDDPRHSHFTPEELDVLAREASMQGSYVMAHAQGTQGNKNAIRAGVRSIEHGTLLDDEVIEMMLEAGTWLVPTLSAPVNIVRAFDAGADMPEPVIRKARDLLDIHMEATHKAAAAGIKIAMGTDAGVGPHGSNLEEFTLMVECGMTPTQSLVVGTTSAAELLRFDHELGRIAEGYRADLVLLDGGINDLSDLADRVREVWKDGQRGSAA
ncbi:amidohydrolase family protein [Streptomyces sp. MMS24-I2-30]|uniref:metal-dependent hydrolase family protein n=1 Tax=Streptomyces sp. MMS24-I2-30 TaxID=3351564 RepID=UPI003896CCBF